MTTPYETMLALSYEMGKAMANITPFNFNPRMTEKLDDHTFTITIKLDVAPNPGDSSHIDAILANYFAAKGVKYLDGTIYL
jgi:hypothetical protein